MTRISSTHHILSIKGLSSELGNSQDTVILGRSRSKRSKSDKEEVKTWERNHVHCKLTKITIQLSRETKGTGSSGNCVRDKVIKVIVRGIWKLQSTEADIVKSLVIKCETLISILNKLMNGKSCVIRFNDGIGNFGGRNDRVSTHDTIGIFLTDLGYKKSSHTSSSSSSHGVSDLESLKHITSFRLLTDDIHNLVDELSSFGVMSLGPVISCSTLSVYEVIGSEKLSEVTTADSIHGTGFEISKDRTWNVTSCLSLVEVYVNTFELKMVVTYVCSLGIDSVLSSHAL
jgi:hypothetical protein